MTGGSRGWGLACIAAGIALVVCVAILREHSVGRFYFISGWALLIAIAVDLIRRLRDAESEHSVGVHAALSVLATSLFATHLELRVPNGWLDGMLAFLFLALLANAIVGSLARLGLRLGVLEAHAAGESFNRAWMFIHVPLTASLMALGIVHGVLVHTHGVMAYVLLGS